ncbi:MAG: hypothetical protein HQM03_10165 [Magnetococcales bacterium]|nr:hypothetical protein [Magnetococcales bacterium]
MSEFVAFIGAQVGVDGDLGNSAACAQEATDDGEAIVYQDFDEFWEFYARLRIPARVICWAMPRYG